MSSGRLRVRRSSKGDSKFNLIYEIFFHKDSPEHDSESLFIPAGQNFELRCLADGDLSQTASIGFENQNRDLLIESLPIENGIRVPIDAFDVRKHLGTVKCTANFKDSYTRSMLIKLEEMAVLPANMDECHEPCYNGGRCGIVNITETEHIKQCVCPANYGGAQCSDPVVNDFVYRLAQVAFGSAGFFIFALLAISLTLGFLFIKERKKRRILSGCMDRSPLESPLTPIQEESPSDVFNFSVENPYQDTCAGGSNGKKGPNRTEQITSDSWVRRSIQRFRKGIRGERNDHLSPDGKLMLSPVPPRPPIT